MFQQFLVENIRTIVKTIAIVAISAIFMIVLNEQSNQIDKLKNQSAQSIESISICESRYTNEEKTLISGIREMIVTKNSLDLEERAKKELEDSIKQHRVNYNDKLKENTELIRGMVTGTGANE